MLRSQRTSLTTSLDLNEITVLNAKQDLFGIKTHGTVLLLDSHSVKQSLQVNVLFVRQDLLPMLKVNVY